MNRIRRQLVWITTIIAALTVVLVTTASAAPVATGWGEELTTLVNAGDARLVALEYVRALDYYERAAAAAPQAFIAPYKIALTLYKWGNAVPVRRGDLWPEALKRVDRARFLDPTNADAVFLAAVIRYRMGDYKSAVDVYRGLEKIRQGDVDLYLDMAVAAWRAGDAALASASLEKARRLQPSSARVQQIARQVFNRP